MNLTIATWRFLELSNCNAFDSHDQENKELCDCVGQLTRVASRSHDALLRTITGRGDAIQTNAIIRICFTFDGRRVNWRGRQSFSCDPADGNHANFSIDADNKSYLIEPDPNDPEGVRVEGSQDTKVAVFEDNGRAAASIFLGDIIQGGEVTGSGNHSLITVYIGENSKYTRIENGLHDNGVCTIVKNPGQQTHYEDSNLILRGRTPQRQ